MSNKHKNSSHEQQGDNALNGNARNGNLPNGQGQSKHSVRDAMPMVASLVGAGVAMGVGLYATRRSWMPVVESWNQQMHDQWNTYAHNDGAEDADNDSMDSGFEYPHAAPAVPERPL